MKTRMVNIHEAKTHLSRLLRRVAAGEEIIIANAGKPVARLVSPTAGAPAGLRPLGLLAGQVWIAPDFDAPMPDEWLDMLEGRHE